MTYYDIIFIRLVKDVWENCTNSAMSPRFMVQNIRKVGRQFRPMRQEDAHEYLRQLVDCMHEEILKSYNITSLSHKYAETTFICRVFGGYLRNELKCPKCQYSSLSHNIFHDLSLELAGNINSIHDAIRNFTRAEKLSYGNEWKCGKCSEKVQVKTDDLL
jgi:ubiquitin carboxyl-terminal hydrolase 36/42